MTIHISQMWEAQIVCEICSNVVNAEGCTKKEAVSIVAQNALARSWLNFKMTTPHRTSDTWICVECVRRAILKRNKYICSKHGGVEYLETEDPLHDGLITKALGFLIPAAERRRIYAEIAAAEVNAESAADAARRGEPTNGKA